MPKLTVSLLLISVFACVPLGAQGTDSEFLTKVLSDVKSESLILQQDAAQLKALTQSTASWQSSANQLEQIKTHLNNVALLVQELNDFRVVAAPWQQIAIDRINPLLRELAGNTQLTIAKLNDNPGSVHLPPYKEYVSAHYELASDLASTISDFVEYARTKAKFEALTRKLELPEP
ncbi:MAG TPA: hypothetical protein VMF91_10275 [Bryobacteraceae bacterium]|nr:hypothetical protein [Bryobacteraceae bacterium]